MMFNYHQEINKKINSNKNFKNKMQKTSLNEIKTNLFKKNHKIMKSIMSLKIRTKDQIKIINMTTIKTNNKCKSTQFMFKKINTKKMQTKSYKRERQ
jgi:hypothetical protein